LHFYKKHNIKIDKVEISSEDLSSLFMYIIVQANQAAFYAHLQVALLFNASASKSQVILDALLSAC
jgi:hypothetical protein